MSDLIERQEAYTTLTEYYHHTTEIQHKALREALERVPSAETHDKRTETHACDCISRKEAIDAHYEYCNKHPDASFPVWSLKILEDLSSSQPDLSGYSDKLWKAAYERGKAEAQQRWIPCSERLPAYGEDVLISIGGYCNVGHIVSVNEEEQYNWYFSG